MEVGESKRLAIVELLLGLRVHRVAVEHHVADINPFGGEGHVKAVGAGAHGEQIAAARHEVANGFSHSELHLRHFGKPHLGGRCFLLRHIGLVPCSIAVGAPELAVLARKVLMVKVQPVVLRQLTVQHLHVIDHIIRNFGVGEHQGDGIVPRQLVLGRIDGNLRQFRQLDLVHIVLHRSDLIDNLRTLKIGNHFIGDAAYQTLVLHGCSVWT